MRRIVLLAGLALTVGCGGGGGGGGGGSVPGPVIVPPPTVVSLALAPASLALDLEGSSEVLSVAATWSDGTVSAVNATWSLVGASNVVSFATAPAPSVVVTPAAIGSVSVRAAYGGRTAQAPVTVAWDVPAEPGPFYGVSGLSLLEYSGASADPPRLVVTDSMFGNTVGACMSRDGATLYATILGLIQAVDVATGAISSPGSIPEGGAFGLVTTEDGKLVTFGDTGTLWKFDPSTGFSVALGSEGVYPFALTLGPGGALYSYNLFSGLIERRVIGASSSTTPATFALGVSIMGNGGLCATKSGEVFYNALSSSDLRRLADLNGDGDALDAGEDTLFGTLPYTWSVDSDSFVQGIRPGGGRSILMNVVPLAVPDPVYDGIWWMRDVDGDGTAESVLRHHEVCAETFEMWALISTR